MRKLSNRKIAITFSILVIIAFIVLIATAYSPEDEEESTVPQQQNPSLGLDFDVGGLGEADEDCSTESEEQDEEEDCEIFGLGPLAPPATSQAQLRGGNDEDDNQMGDGENGQEQGQDAPPPPPEASPPAIQVAALPIQIVSASGAIIGDGTLKVFHEESVNYPNTTRVELELQLNNRYVTPTPSGSELVIIPVVQVTSTPHGDGPSPTPRIPQHEISGMEIHQRMGVSLTCLPASFVGCDEEIDINEATIIAMDGAKWSWILLPGEDIEGSQDLRVELWTVNLVNEQEQSNVIWHHSFQIDTNTASGTVAVNTNTIIVVAIIIVIMILLAVVIFSRGKSPTISTPLKHAKPTVFMSYRRTSSWGIACTIHQQLTEKGADVFIDINDINEGRFDEIIAKSIKERDFFILVMAPDTLESEWVMREVQHAIACNKKIIPVLVNGFNLYDYELPKQVGIIGSHNAVTLTPEFLHAGINRIGKFIGLGEDYSD